MNKNNHDDKEKKNHQEPEENSISPLVDPEVKEPNMPLVNSDPKEPLSPLTEPNNPEELPTSYPDDKEEPMTPLTEKNEVKDKNGQPEEIEKIKPMKDIMEDIRQDQEE